MKPATTSPSLPYGKYRGKPLDLVPASYLQGLARTSRLSSGVREVLTNELERRGLECPSAPLPGPLVPLCRNCGMESFDVRWQEGHSGRRCIRAECMGCGRFLTWLPLVEKWIRQANR
jgi:hypothetical protein